MKKYESSWNRCEERENVEQHLKMTKERYWMNSFLVMKEMEYIACFQEYNLMENVLWPF